MMEKITIKCASFNKVKVQFDKGAITDESLLTVVKFLALTQFQPSYITDFGQPHPHSAILSVFFHFFRAEYDIALQYAYSRDMHNKVIKIQDETKQFIKSLDQVQYLTMLQNISKCFESPQFSLYALDLVCERLK